MRKRIVLFLSTLLFLLATPLSAFAATLALSPSTGTFNKGCGFAVDIILDTAGVETDGTDAILLYDPSRYTATSITPGTIYSDFPGNGTIDNNAGKISISGLAPAPPSAGFNGKGVFATVNFNVGASAPSGAATIRFDFDPNDKAKTTDSNVVQRNTVA